MRTPAPDNDALAALGYTVTGSDPEGWTLTKDGMNPCMSVCRDNLFAVARSRWRAEQIGDVKAWSRSMKGGRR